MRRAAACVLAVVLLAAVGCTGAGDERMACSNAILYSWHMDALAGDERGKLLGWIRQLDISTLYQDFDSDFLAAGDDSFLAEMNAAGVAVMHLAGTPEWASDPEGMIQEIDKVLRFNAGAQTPIEGIVFDVEPHTADDYKEPDDYLEYRRNLASVYAHAQENGLYMVVVLPYWLDRVDATLLPDIIGQCSDEVSVMNYYTAKTTQHIADELRLARQEGKPISSIYELDFEKEDSFGSLDEARKDFEKMYAAYGYNSLRVAYHHFGDLPELSATPQ